SATSCAAVLAVGPGHQARGLGGVPFADDEWLAVPRMEWVGALLVGWMRHPTQPNRRAVPVGSAYW
ncbi:MAG TPA: hypothetical protein VGP82_05820, partial [Ktedonobacterales bacterium]|nr:hypothetical protein [Ktedonobacterales bacterium]